MAKSCSDLDCNSNQEPIDSLIRNLIYKDEFGCPAMLFKSLGASPAACGTGDSCGSALSIKQILELVYHSEGIQIVESTTNTAPRIDPSTCISLPSIETLMNEVLTISNDANECYAIRTVYETPIERCTDFGCDDKERSVLDRLYDAFCIDENGCTALIIAQADIVEEKYIDCDSQSSIGNDALLQMLLLLTGSNGIIGDVAFAALACGSPPALVPMGTTCADRGLNNGTLDVTVIGGTAPITYTVDGIYIQVDDGHFEGLARGDHEVEVEDANGCIGTPITVGINGCDENEFLLGYMTCIEVNDDPLEIHFEGTPGEITGEEVWDAFNGFLVNGANKGWLAKLHDGLPMWGDSAARQTCYIKGNPNAVESGAGFTYDYLGAKGDGSVWWRMLINPDTAMPHDDCAIAQYIVEDDGGTNRIGVGASSNGGTRYVHLNVAYSAVGGNAILGNLASIITTTGVTNNIGVHIAIRTAVDAATYRLNKTQVGSSAVNSGAGAADCELLAFGRNPTTCTSAGELLMTNRCAGIWLFSQALSSTEADAFVDDNETLQTALGRFV